MPSWVCAVVLGSTVVIAIVLGVLWYVIGLARDHDRYGRLEIPAKRTFELPKAEVRLSFEGTNLRRR